MTDRSNDRPRMVYVLERFPADTLSFVYNEIRVLEEEGIGIDIHSLLVGGDCPEEAAEYGARTITLGKISAVRLAKALGYYLFRKPLMLATLLLTLPLDGTRGEPRKAAKILVQVLIGICFAWTIRRGKNHIHAHFAYKAATAALVASRLNGVGFSFTAHGSATVDPAKRYCLRSKVDHAALVVAVSEYNRQVLCGLCGAEAAEKIVVNRTGVLLDQFVHRRTRRRRAGEPFRIICVASLYPIKNHEALLRACAGLAGRGVDFELRLVGKDVNGAAARLSDEAKRLGIADRVEFMGSVDHGRVAELMAGSQACVLTSFSEGIPVSLMESMATGVPVVGPRVTGVPELIRHGVTGLLADPLDPTTFTDALAALVADEALGERLAVAARGHVVAEFDMLANARRLSSVFWSGILASVGATSSRT